MTLSQLDIDFMDGRSVQLFAGTYEAALLVAELIQELPDVRCVGVLGPDCFTIIPNERPRDIHDWLDAP